MLCSQDTSPHNRGNLAEEDKGKGSQIKYLQEQPHRTQRQSLYGESHLFRTLYYYQYDKDKKPQVLQESENKAIQKWTNERQEQQDQYISSAS